MKKKKTFRRAAILAALCLLAALLLPFGAAAQESYPPGTYITNTEMNFRSGPSTDDEILALIPRNTSVKITETAGAWGRLTFGGVDGWMNLEYSSLLPEELKEDTGEAKLVVDISSWTTPDQINWEGLKAEGVDSVILRIAGRGYGSAKSLYEDTAFPEHYRNAKAAGFHIGVYFFSYALTQEQAKEEAALTVRILEENGCELDMPVFIDMEDIDRGQQHYYAGRAVCTAVAETFCSEIEQAGYYAGVYSGKWFTETLIDPAVFEGRATWIAHYGVERCGYTASPIDMWQYTETGKFASVQTAVDISYCYVDFPALIAGKTDPADFGSHVCPDIWEITKEADCLTDGERIKRCADCGIILLKEQIPRLQHTESAPAVLPESTDFQPGDRLTEEALAAMIPSDAEDYEAWRTETLPLVGGTALTYCTSCNTVLTATYYNLTCLHVSRTESVAPATCTQDGVHLVRCAICGAPNEGELLAAQPHEEAAPERSFRNCEEGGSLSSVCKTCGAELFYQFLKEEAHVFELTETFRDPTLFAGGAAVYTCGVCGRTERRDTPPLTLGDCSGDGKVAAEDARIALRIAVELEEPDDTSIVTGDTDNNGAITAADARNILRIAVGLTDSETLLKTFYGAQ